MMFKESEFSEEADGTVGDDLSPGGDVFALHEVEEEVVGFLAGEGGGIFDLRFLIFDWRSDFNMQLPTPNSQLPASSPQLSLRAGESG